MCNPHECSNAVLGHDDWRKGPCGQNPRELLDKIKRLQAIVNAQATIITYYETEHDRAEYEVTFLMNCWKQNRS